MLLRIKFLALQSKFQKSLKHFHVLILHAYRMFISYRTEMMEFHIKRSDGDYITTRWYQTHGLTTAVVKVIGNNYVLTEAAILYHIKYSVIQAHWVKSLTIHWLFV